MVKKTLLSLAVATAIAGLTGCNVSSTDKYDNKITDNAPAPAALQEVGDFYPIFAPERAELPLATDLVFAKAATTDGTADTADTQPPVTTALNKLDGFSTIAPIYINFKGEPDPQTVIAGQTVFLIKLKTGQGIDALDLKSIMVGTQGAPVAAVQPNGLSFAGPIDYTADVVKLGDTSAVRILLKKPLDPKTKYIVALTNGITDGTNNATGSSTYQITSSNNVLPSKALAPVRTAVQGWEQIAGGYIEQYSAHINSLNPIYPLMAQDNIILSYAFTTGGVQDVLHAMAAPGTFMAQQLPTIAHAEGAISQKVIATALGLGADQATAEAQAEATLLQVAQGTALKINAAAGSTVVPIDANTRTALKASVQLAPKYYIGLISTVADGSGAGLDSIIDKPKSRTYAPIAGAALPYDTLLTAQITPKVEAQIPDIATGEGAITQATIAAGGNQTIADGKLDQVAAGVATAINTTTPGTFPDVNAPTVRPTLKDSPALQPYYLAGLRKAITDAKVLELSSKGIIYQGGLKLPNYLPEAVAGVADPALGSWTASDAAAVALGKSAAPIDSNGSTNVTYRFPFAKKLGDNVIPVLATLPKSDCDPDGAGPASGKPAAGWPVVIYQHGITVDRTAGLLVGNALAGQCIAMVAIDHTMHGVAPLNSSGANSLRLFNIEQVAAATPASNTPFAYARSLQLANPVLAELKERHNNVAKNAQQQNIAMVFKGALDANNDPVTAESVGKSGDLYINLLNFSRVRDGMRQTVLDMMNLSASIGTMDIDGDTTADLDASNVYFIGHSLGGIIGTTFLAVNNDPLVRAYNSNLPEIKAAALGNPGGGIVKLLENSPTFSVPILAGLGAKGITQGSENIEKYFGVLQATLDSADPINFAQSLTALPVLVYNDVGGVAGAPGEDDDGAKSDQVVPNNALNPAIATAKSYLAGTDPLIARMGITTVLNETTAIAAVTASPLGGGKGYFPSAASATKVRAEVRMGKGTHSTFSSADPQDVFVETFQQIITFFDPYGATKLLGLPGDQQGFVIKNQSVLEQTE